MTKLAGNEIAEASKKLSSNTLASRAGSVAKMTKKVGEGISNSRTLVSSVDFIIKLLFNFSPVDEWVKKPFFGDWDAMTATATQWQTISKELHQVQNALEKLSSEIDDESWSGNASVVFVLRNNSIAQAASQGVEPCNEIAEMLNTVAELSEKALDLVLDGIEAIVKLCNLIASELSIPVVGAVMATATGVMEAKKVFEIGAQIVEALNNLYTALEVFTASAQALTELASQTVSILSEFGSGYASVPTATTGSIATGNTSVSGGSFTTGPFAGSGGGSGGGSFGGR